MNSERYETVEQLFHEALELSRGSRSAFLSRACGADEDLRREVESLLAAHEKAGDFVASSAMRVAAEWLGHDEEAGTLRGRIGDYEVQSLIGRGGMGEVYLAHDTRLDRKVAVKLIRSALTSNADAVRRFEQEARAASSLNHPNIVTIYEIGDLLDRRFLAMELVQGQSLAAMVGRPVDVTSLARLGAQLARALSVAHAAGIVHRDIKPENVMVREDGYVKVLDFGLARLAPFSTVAGAPDTVASHGLMLGTPRYMSPEQARGDTATSASDVFSLGVVLYELATGTHPFESESTLGTLHAITSHAVPSPVQWVPDMSPMLERLLLWMLEKPEAARPTAAQVEAALTKLAVGPRDAMDALSWSIARPPRRRDHSLPSQRTALVGRGAELASVKDMLLRSGVRLMTLTGPGGTGKTRLALQVAEDLVPHFEGGASFVNLAPIADPRLVASAVARSLGVRESGDLPLARAIAEHLRDRDRTLLLIDNFEQVSDAAALVKELLDACPALTVLVTSRLVLHIYGEQEFPVPPLPLPAAGATASPADLMQCASIALFVQRATAGRPDFALTPKNAGAVVEICRRLDGLPLAIELAAARVKILPPSQLLARIERPLELLTGGARDLPERQQTLRQAIKWSYDLLTPPEQKLFRRLSVFTGGCTLEAAEAVCNTLEDLGVDVLSGVTSLVDNSLLTRRESVDGDPRFVLLETFREYGRERLLEHEESSATQRAHAAYLLVLAEEENLEMSPVEREDWLRCCDVEHDNFRAAIHWLITTDDVEWALRLCGALFRFWEQRDHLTEGRETLARVLGMPGAAAPTRLRARALYCAGVLADIQADFSPAEMLGREACDIYRHFDDTQGVATTMTVMAFQAQRQGRYAEATSIFGETVSLWEQLGDVTAVGLATSNMAHAAKEGGNFDLARSLLERVVASSQARGDVRGVALALNGLGDVKASQGNHGSARRYHRESLARYREIDDHWGIARVLADLASVDLQAGEYAEADESLKKAVQAFRALGHQRGVARHLELLSFCASCQSRDEAAVVLASAAAAIRHKIGAHLKQVEREKIEHTLAQARMRISAEAYETAWKEGLTATLDRILGIEPAPRS
jgi:predicted ATPase/serine/threonine protein kinase